MSDTLIGQNVGQYTVLSKIGQGGMASVYRAYQPSIARYVAIKVLSKDFAKDPAFVKRFKGEAKAVAALEHPHILPVYDFGSQDNFLYMVMRLIEGGTLADMIIEQTSPLSFAQVVQIIENVAGALEYAHSHGIVHRDIKPSNMLIDQHGEVQLTDFGLAKVITGSHQSRITKVGTVVGTATYMAPEQAADEEIDGRCDLYSLGVVLFEMLTGQPPYDADTMVAIALKHINEPTPLLREINPDVPEAFEKVVFKAMEKWPEDRYQTAGEMGRALEQALKSMSRPETSIEPPPLKTGNEASPSTETAKILPARPRRPTGSAPINQPDAAVATQPVSFKQALKQPWLWASALAATITTVVLFVVLLFWFGGGGDTTVVISDTSLLNYLIDYPEVIDALGPFEEKHPGSNYARQHFGGGLTYWWDNPSGSNEFIYVIPDGQQEVSGDGWSRYNDHWTPGEPPLPPDCPDATEPLGPKNGFGKLWCYNYNVRDILRNPTDEETYDTVVTPERYDEGIILPIPIDNQILILFDDGTWQIVNAG